MLLAHHHSDRYDRCAFVGGVPVCRRCLVLYPTIVAAMIATALGLGSVVPTTSRNALVWLLPLPALADYVAETVGGRPYAPRRQALTTAVAAVAVGAGLAWEVAAPDDVSVWTMLACYGGMGVLATAAALTARAGRIARAHVQEAAEEAERRLFGGDADDRRP